MSRTWRTFIYDNNYLGTTVGRSVFPRLVDDLEELYAGGYSDVLLTGGIGWGKSRMAEIIFAYDLYQVSCLRDPGALALVACAPPELHLPVNPNETA